MQLFENVCKCSQEQRLAADVQHLKWYGVQARAGEANRQVFLLLSAAKSAPLRQRGWRPSVQQSKLNLQMCLCSKYLSPAGYYLSPDGVWALSFQKKQSTSSDVVWKAKSVPFLMYRHTIHLQKVHRAPKGIAQQLIFPCWAGKALPQSKLTLCFCHQQIVTVDKN